MIITLIKISVCLALALLVFVLYLLVLNPRNDISISDQEWEEWVAYLNDQKQKKAERKYKNKKKEK